MRKLSAFNFITLNGFLSDPDGDISWHMHGNEENQFAAESLQAGNTLLFGRKTYEMMAGYWPTPTALQNDPIIAKGMNNAEKIVISRTLKNAGWQNTIIISENVVEAIRQLKQLPGNDITILGSGSIVTLLSESSLIDEYLIMIDPVAISAGTSVFQSIRQPLNLKLTEVKSFKSGVVLLSYIKG
jgi:dihydrofolate reductase